jgi:hypothetical protein
LTLFTPAISVKPQTGVREEIRSISLLRRLLRDYHAALAPHVPSRNIAACL